MTDTAYRVHLDGSSGDQDIRDFELFSARRALALLKSRLGREGLLELLRDEITASDAFFRAEAMRSEGKETVGTTVLRAHGISAAQFGGWLASSFDREDVMLAAHPEHYVIRNEGPGRAHIVETLDEHVCSFYMGGWDESAEAPPSAGASDARRSRLALADGTAFGWVSTVFTDTEDGFTAELAAALPASCAPSALRQHLEHFAVEFRNWILDAARELDAAGRLGRAAAEGAGQQR